MREQVTVVVQVDGKVRSRLTVDVSAPEQAVREQALAEDKVRPWLAGREVAKVVVVPGRLVNIVTRCMSRLRASRWPACRGPRSPSVTGGCGYTLQGNLPDHLKTVSVPVFKNRSTEAGRGKHDHRGRGQRVHQQWQAQGGVSRPGRLPFSTGEITGYSVQSLTYDSKLNLRSYRLTVSMNVRFRDLKRSELLWQQNGLVEEVSFDVAGQVSDTISREEGAVKQAALEIGRKMVNRAVDRF